jgi:hypothetical protein
VIRRQTKAGRRSKPVTAGHCRSKPARSPQLGRDARHYPGDVELRDLQAARDLRLGHAPEEAQQQDPLVPLADQLPLAPHKVAEGVAAHVRPDRAVQGHAGTVRSLASP